MTGLYEVVCINTGTGVKVYKENLPWNKEPDNLEASEAVRFLRPSARFDSIFITHIGFIDTETGKLI